jgi:hypothetical protein
MGDSPCGSGLPLAASPPVLDSWIGISAHQDLFLFNGALTVIGQMAMSSLH